MNNSPTYPSFQPSKYDSFQLLGNLPKQHSGFADDNIGKQLLVTAPYFNITGADKVKLKDEIKLIRDTRKAEGYFTSEKADITARHITTNKIMRQTIKDVKKAYKAEDIPDAEIWDGDLSEFEIEEEEPTFVNDTLQWVRDIFSGKPHTDPVGMGIGTPTSATPQGDIKPKDNKSQSAAWNAAGIALAVVGVSLIAWGIVRGIKARKNKKAAAANI